VQRQPATQPGNVGESSCACHALIVPRTTPLLGRGGGVVFAVWSCRKTSGGMPRATSVEWLASRSLSDLWLQRAVLANLCTISAPLREIWQFQLSQHALLILRTGTWLS
jgi:hypothetical protein